MNPEKEILIIDDSKFDMLILEKLLRYFKLADQIVSFISPLRALDYLKNKPTEKEVIVFLDIMMPEMDGFKFVDELFEHSNKSTVAQNTVIYLVSSTLDPKDIQRAKQDTRITGLIHKPVQSEDIINCFVSNEH